MDGNRNSGMWNRARIAMRPIRRIVRGRSLKTEVCNRFGLRLELREEQTHGPSTCPAGPGMFQNDGGRSLFVPAEDKGQDVNLFLTHSVKFVGIDSQRPEDGWGYLLVGNRRLDLLFGPACPGEQQSGVEIVFVQAAVLGDLGAAGEDD